MPKPSQEPKNVADDKPSGPVFLELHYPEGGQKPLSITDHASRILTANYQNDITYAEALARTWLTAALEGNMAALKEALLRFAPVEAAEKPVKYMLTRDPDCEWDRLGPNESINHPDRPA